MKKLALKKVAKPAKSSEVKVDRAVEKNLKKFQGGHSMQRSPKFPRRSNLNRL